MKFQYLPYKTLFLLTSLSLICTSLILVCCGSKQGSATGRSASASEEILPVDDRHDTVMVTDYLMGKFNPATHPLFRKAGKPHTGLTDAWLREETLRAFGKMQEAAKKEGIALTIVSATRNFDTQKGIWEAKWSGKRLVEGKDLSKVANLIERARIILRYSSMPGTSRHHWGTDIDINSVEPAYFKTPRGKKEYNWLAAHAAEFGFCQPYTPKGKSRPTGYEEEPWHWSYTPLSSVFLEKYNQLITHQMLTGFEGHETADTLQVIPNFVYGINPACR